MERMAEESKIDAEGSGDEVERDLLADEDETTLLLPGEEFEEEAVTGSKSRGAGGGGAAERETGRGE